jgi:hypothetical protein
MLVVGLRADFVANSTLIIETLSTSPFPRLGGQEFSALNG